jgi:NAD(P)-dependent dehydrogenase (short-subunit alcohol dehydrogenase family)
MSVTGKVTIITGAASGIGRAVAEGFAKDGASIIGFDINREGLEETARLCGSKMLSASGDVRLPGDVDRLVAETLGHYGRIDVLFNNAGISDTGFFADLPFARWLKVIEINLIGAAYCMHCILPVMFRQKYGRIINVVSRGAESVTSRNTGYAASKAGLVSLTKNVANCIDRKQYPDVLINGLVPGITRTAIWGAALQTGAIAQRTMSQMQEPEAVYPHAKFLVELPSGGPSGRIFFHSEDYPIFSRFNAETPQTNTGP